MSFFDRLSEATRTDNNKSPFGELGLLGDPLHYAVGDKYDNFMRKTWEYPNEYAGKYLTKFDTFDRKINPIHRAIDRTEVGGKIKDFVHNKPGDSALAVLGSIFGGGALLGGMGGGSAGGGAAGGSGAGSLGTGVGSDLGYFSNGGTAGLQGMGGGNAGLMAANHGIGGGAGMGAATSSTGGFMGSMNDPRQWMQMAQQMPQGGMGGQQQEQQQRPLQPVVIKGRVWWI